MAATYVNPLNTCILCYPNNLPQR